eukprot:jgi/Mesvir1/7448/Mv25807-RA.1
MACEAGRGVMMACEAGRGVVTPVCARACVCVHVMGRGKALRWHVMDAGESHQHPCREGGQRSAGEAVDTADIRAPSRAAAYRAGRRPMGSTPLGETPTGCPGTPSHDGRLVPRAFSIAESPTTSHADL